MATYFVWDGGDNTTGTSWGTAKTTLTAGLALGTSAGDIIKVAHTHTGDNALTVDTVFSAAANNVTIISVNKDSSDAPTVMGTSAWIGHSTLNRAVTISPLTGGNSLYVWGLTLRTASASADNIIINNYDGGHVEIENCYLWLGTTATSALIVFGLSGSGTANCFVRAVNCTFRFGNVSQMISASASVELYNCSISADGSAITTIFSSSVVGYTSSGIYVEGCDFSAAATSANIIGSGNAAASGWTLVNCKLPGSYVLRAATGTNKAQGEVTLFNCYSGDAHIHLSHADAMGETRVETGIYANDGASPDGGTTRTSWKIVSTANASFGTPYVSPWFDKYWSGTAAIQPYFEILRNDSTTAFDNDEVWADFGVQNVTGTTQSTIVTDRAEPLAAGSAQDNGVGLSGWTGESGTAWSGKLVSPSVTPAEVGDLRARVCVGLASATVYIDPKIRT